MAGVRFSPCNMKDLQTPEIWYITGSQHLYGRETLNQVAVNSRKIVEELNGSGRLPPKLIWKPTPSLRRRCGLAGFLS
jgi:L-arabinose isomerase